MFGWPQSRGSHRVGPTAGRRPGVPAARCPRHRTAPNRSLSSVSTIRFSGGTRGPCIGHVSPEAKAGGLIAYVKNGDKILIDIPRRRIEVKLTGKEIDRRKKTVKLLPAKVKRGYLSRYAAMVTSASTGAVFAKE